MSDRFLRSAVLWLMLFAAGCAGQKDGGVAPDTSMQSAPAPASSQPTATTPSGAVITLEVAANDETRQRGLMFRESIAPGHGMIFLFPADDVFSFWMKNTYIPLDMLWLDQQWKIVHVKSGVPPCQADPCPSYDPGVKARSVLELGAGESQRLGLKAGDRLQMKGLENLTIR